MGRIASRFGTGWWWIVAFLIGLCVRVSLMSIPGHSNDLYAYSDWTWHLINKPLAHFYAINPGYEPDHLPGDVWILKIMGEVSTRIAPSLNVMGPTYEYVIKGMATSFDVIIVALLLSAGRLLIGRWGGMFPVLALAYWWQPAAMLNASVWGQTDSISTAAAVGVLCLTFARRFTCACVLLTLCVLIKPLFVLLAVPLFAAWYAAELKHTSRRSTSIISFARSVLVTGGMCALVATTLILPFNVGLWPGWTTWSLWERIAYAQNRYTVSHGAAFNLWGVLHPSWPAPDDRNSWIGGLSRHDAGFVFFMAIVAFVCWLLWKKWRGDVTMVFASNILMLGAFLFLTRMHERYGFPLLALCLLLIGVAPRARGYAVATSLIVAANIYFGFVWTNLQADTVLPRFGSLEPPSLITVLGIANLATFGWLCCLAVSTSRRVPEELGLDVHVDVRQGDTGSSYPNTRQLLSRSDLNGPWKTGNKR